MKHIADVTRLGVLLLVADTLSACANLQAVRDFSKQSAQLAAYTDVTNRVVSTPDVLLQQVPQVASFGPVRDKLKASAQARAERRDSLLKIHNVVAGYMGALANLAGEDTFSLSSSIDKVSGALVEAPDLGIKADTVDAFAKIATVVTSWITEAIQVREVKAMVAKHGDAMEQMLAGMEDVTSSMLAILEEDQKVSGTFAEYYEGGFRFTLGIEQPAPTALTGDARKQYEEQMEIARMRRDAVGLLVVRSNAAMRADQEAAVSSARSALAGVRLVRAGHAEMRNNMDKLTSAQVVAQLRRFAADLQDVRSNLKKL